ncbi:ribonuclease PH [Fictibacillus enclensis]|uniref:ribonuclease PH n=1 Tax=Fictibacillus enclensis TaxID=1017270 RepID=UPI0025A172AF|nr:ribonuclease PH [Fictibacillus enclensis]MDM5339301.1 ribonuclease PH [Fictibacillus enclensis]
MRNDGRSNDELRFVRMEKDYIKHAEGSVLVTVGDTKVICTASIEDRVPHFMRNQGKGWITAEYSMLPRATEQRTVREASRGKVTGRTMEIQRLIGRALRSVVDLPKMGERTLWIDCDVIQADGGTRTASITGAFVAMVLAFVGLIEAKTIKKMPVKDFLAATSVGIDNTEGPILDLNYAEDANVNVDMNIVMTGSGEFVELQGTGEEATFSYAELQSLLKLGSKGVGELIELQKEVLGEWAKLINEAEDEK